MCRSFALVPIARSALSQKILFCEMRSPKNSCGEAQNPCGRSGIWLLCSPQRHRKQKRAKVGQQIAM